MADPWKRKPGNCFARLWYTIGHRRVWDRGFLVASLPLGAWTCQTPGGPFRVSLPHSRRVTLNDPAISIEDAQITVIARSGGLTLATRNTKDLSEIEALPLVNPWT